MKALYILLGIIIFFSLLLSCRIKVYLKLQDELTVRAGFGPIVLNLMPKKKKKIKLSDFTYKKHQKRLLKDKKKAEKKAQKKSLKDEKKKQAKELAKTAQAAAESTDPADDTGKLESIIALIEFVFEELPRLASTFRTKIKVLDITVAGKDAADTAKKYGVICFAVSCLIELLENKTKMTRRKTDHIFVQTDFLGDKTKFRLDVSFNLSLFSILCTGIRALGWMIGQKIRK